MFQFDMHSLPFAHTMKQDLNLSIYFQGHIQKPKEEKDWFLVLMLLDYEGNIWLKKLGSSGKKLILNL